MMNGQDDMKKENAAVSSGKPSTVGSNLTYQVIRENILEMMKSGRMVKGDRLPTEKELAEKFEVNHQTLRRAIAPLVEAGYLRKQVGAGTFLNVDAAEISFSDSGMPVQKSTMAVFCPLQYGSHLSELMHHLVPLAEQRGIAVAHYPLSLNAKHLPALLEGAMGQSLAAAMIFLPEDISLSAEMIRLLHQTSVPIVTARPIEGFDKNCYEKPEIFGWADDQAVELACRHYLNSGYRRIFYLGPDERANSTLNRRILAFNRVMSCSDVFSKVRFAGTSQDMDDFAEDLQKYRREAGVVCFDDDCATRLMMALHKKKIRIPEDVAVLGVGDVSVAALSDPPLSTICFDYDYVAGAMLDHALALGKGSGAQVSTPGEAKVQLIVRESCGAKMKEHLAFKGEATHKS